MSRGEAFLRLGTILGITAAVIFLTSGRVEQKPVALVAAAEASQPSAGSKEANETCKKELGKVEDITKIECTDTEKAAGETIKGHCTTSGQCKAEKICGAGGSCKSISENTTPTSKPCNTEMGGGTCRQEMLDIINNHPKELNYYATEDVRKQLRETLGAPEETQYYVKSDDGRYFSPYTGKEVLQVNDTPDGKTITLKSSDGQEITVNRDTPVDQLRQWVNDGDPRVRYAALEDAFLGKNVDLSPLAKEVSNSPLVRSMSNSVQSPFEAIEQLSSLTNQGDLVKTSGVSGDISFKQLQEFRALGAEAFNLPASDQQVQDVSSGKFRFSPDSTFIPQTTGFQLDPAVAVARGVMDINKGGEGATPNLLPMQDVADRSDLLVRSLREVFQPNAFNELSGKTPIAFLGQDKSVFGVYVPGSPITAGNSAIMISRSPESDSSQVFYTAMHEIAHRYVDTVGMGSAQYPDISLYWPMQVYGTTDPGVYTPDWQALTVLPPGMSIPYSAASPEEHMANTFADMASGNFQERAAQDPAYKQAIDTVGGFFNRISKGMDTVYFEKLAPAAERFNFQLDQIRQRIQNLLR